MVRNEQIVTEKDAQDPNNKPNTLKEWLGVPGGDLGNCRDTGCPNIR